MKTLTIQFWCACNGRQFQAVFTKFLGRFRLTQVLESSPVASRLGTGVQSTVPVSDIDFSGWACPYCASLDYFFHGGECGRYCCQGTITADGTCSCLCGWAGHLDGQLTSVTGSAASGTSSDRITRL